MEEYVKDAPKTVDPNAPQSRRAGVSMQGGVFFGGGGGAVMECQGACCQAMYCNCVSVHPGNLMLQIKMNCAHKIWTVTSL